MAKLIFKRFSVVLLFLVLSYAMLVTSAFADTGVVIAGYLFDYLNGLVDAGEVIATKYIDTIGDVATEVFELDKDNYKKFVDYSNSNYIPVVGSYISLATANYNTYQVLGDEVGYADVYVSMCSFYENGRQFSDSYAHYYKDSSGYHQDLYNFGDPTPVSTECRSSSRIYFYLRMKMNTKIECWDPSDVFYYTLEWSCSHWSTVLSSGDSLGSLTDWGIVVSHSPLDKPKLSPADVPDGYSVIIPKSASSFDELTYKPSSSSGSGGDTSADSSGDTPDSGGEVGDVKGYIILGGSVDVNLKVPDINVNVNVNSGTGNGSSYEMPDTEFFNEYLDDALEESSGIRRFIADFFGTLPGQITTLICIGLVISILLRIISR